MNLNKRAYIAIAVVSVVSLIALGVWVVGLFGGSDDNPPPNAGAGVGVGTTFTTPTSAPEPDWNDGDLPEGVPPDKYERPTPPKRSLDMCGDGPCKEGMEVGDGLGSTPEYQAEWEAVALGFATAFGDKKGKDRDQWLSQMEPYVLPGLFGRMQTIGYERVNQLDNPRISLVEDRFSQEVSARADYDDGTILYIAVQLMGVDQGWKVTTYDTPRFGR